MLCRSFFFYFLFWVCVCHFAWWGFSFSFPPVALSWPCKRCVLSKEWRKKSLKYMCSYKKWIWLERLLRTDKNALANTTFVHIMTLNFYSLNKCVHTKSTEFAFFFHRLSFILFSLFICLCVRTLNLAGSLNELG